MGQCAAAASAPIPANAPHRDHVLDPQELPKELVESQFPSTQQLPDYFTNASYTRFTPEVDCLPLPGARHDAARSGCTCVSVPPPPRCAHVFQFPPPPGVFMLQPQSSHGGACHLCVHTAMHCR
jgi:hypothetical protein